MRFMSTQLFKKIIIPIFFYRITRENIGHTDWNELISVNLDLK